MRVNRGEAYKRRTDVKLKPVPKVTFEKVYNDLRKRGDNIKIKAKARDPPTCACKIGRAHV